MLECVVGAGQRADEQGLDSGHRQADQHGGHDGSLDQPGMSEAKFLESSHARPFDRRVERDPTLLYRNEDGNGRTFAGGAVYINTPAIQQGSLADVLEAEPLALTRAFIIKAGTVVGNHYFKFVL